MPYALYVGIASVPAEWLSREANYAVRLVVVAAAIAWAWRRYLPLTGPKSAGTSVAIGLVAGAVTCAVWVMALLPFVETRPAWGDTAFVLRACAATLLVPIFEEQLMRGYVLRLGTQWREQKSFDKALDECSVYDLPPGRMNLFGVALSTVLFTVGHAMIEWPAAVSYSLLMCALYAWRKDLLTLVVAHATTNLLLAVYVWRSGEWGLWG